MINEPELRTIIDLIHYLNEADGLRATDIAFDVRVIDSNGDCLARVERLGESEYQLIPGGNCK